MDVPGEYNLPLPQVLNDTFRVNFLHDYIQQGMLAVTEDNINLTGYTVWALYDNFEWAEGYNARFGIVSVVCPALGTTEPSASCFLCPACEAHS